MSFQEIMAVDSDKLQNFKDGFIDFTAGSLGKNF